MRTIEIDGMACGGCEDNVVDALDDVPGVESATADHEAGTASVEGDAADAALTSAIEEAGHETAF
ncbi:MULTISPECIES: heavy-metal-associated domain-containing protein [Haloferacaceae]|uniref:Heavy-metal-associated domain-containing protein n=1 Tax=Halorubrum glutamatedens TaxID=2707018 RepID=A0ABD5QUD2_9EURY|nr:heavy metal-associated domain-containing protein [Halobellus captivus]